MSCTSAPLRDFTPPPPPMQAHWDTDMPEQDEAETPARPSTVQGILRTLFEMQRGGAPAVGDDAQAGLSLNDISRLLGGASGWSYITNPRNDEDDEDDEDYVDDEDDDGYDHEHSYLPRSGPSLWYPPATEPQHAGLELLMGGEFGRVGPKIRSRQNDVNIARTLRNRAYNPRPIQYKEDVASNLVPNSNGTAVAAYDANIYCAQYSADSTFYYTCSQDFKLHVYDTTAPPAPPNVMRANRRADPSLHTTMKVLNTIQGQPGRWTITDTDLSRDNERMIYSSITPTVYMTNTLDNSPQIPISFSDRSARSRGYEEGFGIWSCKFSADGNEVVAGGSGKIFVYDLVANRRTVKISAHEDDVNSVCWADTASGNVLVSASDDTFLKVWDRRSLGSSNKPSGVLIGHTEGITNVSAKGDGRYLISNGKDQALRLWDLRKMRSSAEYDQVKDDYYGIPNFDYRYPHYPKPRRSSHPQDCSVMTYRGHAVLRTLIRCHFSPAETTGGQYIYSGSADGRIHIWSLDGRVVQILDRSKTLPMTFDPSAPEPEVTSGSRSSVVVRDISWHSQEPVMLSAGWDTGSVVARHEWKGLGKMHGSIEDWVERRKLEIAEPSRTRRSTRLETARQRAMPGAFGSGEEED